MKNKLITITLLIATALSACGTPAATRVSPANVPNTNLTGTSATAPTRAPVAPIVSTQSGHVQGVVTNDILAFKGIPYAAPPVGELRWRLPQPMVPWTDVYPADKFRSACIQPSGPLTVLPVSQREDCLTLNVWTSGADPKAQYPVMVWIHGGGFSVGSGSEPAFDGQFLAKRGAVVVTLNYRLGPLGFFAHPALEAETPNGPVNFGLYDQLAALQWVQKNILAFGGDPQNVTVFGESAGSTSVMALFASPLARGLFQRGIVESYSLTGQSRDQAIANGIQLATALSLDGEHATAADLRAVPAEKFPAVSSQAGDPVTGDSYLPQSILASFQEGTESPVPLIIGNNSDEASLFELAGIDPAAMPKKFEAAGIAIKDLYPGVTKDSELGRYVLRDAFFTTATRLLAQQHAQRAPTWQYYFSYLPVKQRSTMSGVMHGGEIPFVFGTGEKVSPYKEIFMPEDTAMSQRVMSYWYAFAATGKPEPASEPAWPVTDAQQDQMMIFGETIAAQPDFMGKQVQAYLVVLNELLKNNVNFWVVVFSP